MACSECDRTVSRVGLPSKPKSHIRIMKSGKGSRTAYHNKRDYYEIRHQLRV